MAMRSYLYSATELPTADSIPPKVPGISQHNSIVPLAHKLLIGRQTTVIPSMLWNGPVAVAGDFAGGVELLTSVLRRLGEGEVTERGAFDDMVSAATKHLEEQAGEYFLLEAGEIFQLTGAAPDTAAHDLVNEEIQPAVRDADAVLAGENEAWLESLRADWRPHFDSFYSRVLYFSFRDDTE